MVFMAGSRYGERRGDGCRRKPQNVFYVRRFRHDTSLSEVGPAFFLREFFAGRLSKRAPPSEPRPAFLVLACLRPEGGEKKAVSGYGLIGGCLFNGRTQGGSPAPPGRKRAGKPRFLRKTSGRVG